MSHSVRGVVRWWSEMDPRPTVQFAWQQSLSLFINGKRRQASLHIIAITASPELSTGQMDPRVGSGHDFAGFWRVGSGRVGSALWIFFVVYFLFVGT